MHSMLGLSVVLLVVMFSLFALRRYWLRLIASGLVSADGENANCDALVVMNGNISTRPYRAYELYQQNPVPILIARLADTQEVQLGVIPNYSQATADLLIMLGVAKQHVCVIETDRWVAGTWSEAVVLCERIRQQKYQDVCIVTDVFHSKRALRMFANVMASDGVTFVTASSRYSQNLRAQWWCSEYGIVQVVVEYLKTLHYWRLRHFGSRPMRASELPLAEKTRKSLLDIHQQNG